MGDNSHYLGSDICDIYNNDIALLRMINHDIGVDIPGAEEAYGCSFGVLIENIADKTEEDIMPECSCILGEGSYYIGADICDIYNNDIELMRSDSAWDNSGYHSDVEVMDGWQVMCILWQGQHDHDEADDGIDPSRRGRLLAMDLLDIHSTEDNYEKTSMPDESDDDVDDVVYMTSLELLQEIEQLKRRRSELAEAMKEAEFAATLDVEAAALERGNVVMERAIRELMSKQRERA